MIGVALLLARPALRDELGGALVGRLAEVGVGLRLLDRRLQLRELGFRLLELLVEIGSARGVSAAQVALAYTIGKPAVTSVIVGARTEEQLTDDLASAELVLTDDEVSRLDEVSAEPLRYPYWHQALNAPDRLSPADLSLLGRHLD